MAIPIYQVDAFADTIFKGNPVAVIPLANWPDDWHVDCELRDGRVFMTGSAVTFMKGLVQGL